MRLYEMFIGDFEKAAPWNTASIKGCKRFLDRVWSMQEHILPGEGYRPETEALMHRTIKKVSEDIEVLKHNTAIAALMSPDERVLRPRAACTRDEFKTLLTSAQSLCSRTSPKSCGSSSGFEGQMAYAAWPTYEDAKCVESTVEIAVQVNGKVKARLKVPADIESADAIALAKAEPNVAPLLDGKTVVKEIYVKGKLVNLAVKG